LQFLNGVVDIFLKAAEIINKRTKEFGKYIEDDVVRDVTTEMELYHTESFRPMLSMFSIETQRKYSG
jgi:acyl-CoA reductase-like NAD-dependent aldehyde dehydrogenase